MALPFIAASMLAPHVGKLFGLKRGGSISNSLAKQAMAGIKVSAPRKRRGGRMYRK